MRLALSSDLPLLEPLMRGYYHDDGLEYDEARVRRTVSRLLGEPQWGAVYLIEDGSSVVGYLAVCIGFSLELGGNDAFIDELYVLPEHRKRGHARRALEFAAARLCAVGVRALHLEVDRNNLAAQRVYANLGYKKRDRYYLMTCTMEPLSAEIAGGPNVPTSNAWKS